MLFMPRSDIELYTIREENFAVFAKNREIEKNHGPVKLNSREKKSFWSSEKVETFHTDFLNINVP